MRLACTPCAFLPWHVASQQLLCWLSLFTNSKAARKLSQKKGPVFQLAAKKNGNKITATVPKYMYFGKASLATVTHTDEDRNTIYTKDFADGAEAIALKKMASKSCKNSELCSTPGMAIALASSSIDAAVKIERKTDKSSCAMWELCSSEEADRFKS
eukprot:292505-Amphidinium_carterae.1